MVEKWPLMKIKAGGFKDEIIWNILVFIAIMSIAKLFSSIWKFRLYRKYTRKSSVRKKYKLPPRAVHANVQLRADLIDTAREPKHSYKVTDWGKFRATLKVGQHYAIRRKYLGFYLFHHFLISEIKQHQVFIIHYNGEAGVFLKSGSKIFGHVFEESVELKDSHYFDIPNNLYYVADPGYPTDSHVIDGIVERARGRIGENRYGITYNNCEHFVRWALTGTPHCQQYDTANVSEKVVAAMVDELPNIGARMSMKLCKELLYGITMGVEQLVLQNSARLVQHTASASVASILSTGAATFGWTSPVEAAFLTFRILDWKYHMSKGTMSTRDYNNAKDKAITGSVFSLTFTTLGAMIGQLLIPLPAIGAVFGSFWGGFIGRIVGILLAGGGIAIKEKYFFNTCNDDTRLWVYNKLNVAIDDCKNKLGKLFSNNKRKMS